MLKIWYVEVQVENSKTWKKIDETTQPDSILWLMAVTKGEWHIVL